eukprot:Skav221997  [mRNA]  locus=scaffold2020:56899:57102:- [translate_table: standard]
MVMVMRARWLSSLGEKGKAFRLLQGVKHHPRMWTNSILADKYADKDPRGPASRIFVRVLRLPEESSL